MRLWSVNAFAEYPFHGNPACVVEPLEIWPNSGWMQTLAKELKHEATAFLLRTKDAGRFGLRWFTLSTELPLCGHATLAATHILATEFGVSAATFDTRSAVLDVSKVRDRYELDFPASPPERIDTPAGLAAALGVDPMEVWRNRYLIALLKNEEQVRTLAPDVAALKAISARATGGIGNIGVASLADEGRPYDIVDRFFAPGVGISEDPATGSLHCMLSPLFSLKLGRAALRYHQAFPGRGGDLECEHRGERVLLRGKAVTLYSGEFRPQVMQSASI